MTNQKEIEARLYSKQDHAKSLVSFLEYASKENSNILDYCFHLYIYKFLNMTNINHDDLCDICSSFHSNNNLNICPCNQYEGYCGNCYFNQGNFGCNCNRYECYLSKEEVEENKIKWKQELIKQTWIMIEDVLGDELYDLPI